MGVRLIAAVLGIALTAAIVWASFAGEPLFTEGAAILEMPWGVVTLADLYVGFILSATIIFLAERDKRVAALWTLPIFFLGNVWTALWLVVRAKSLAARLGADV
ncbi:MAG: hypothetical protein AAF527_00890 [Pseudomonadota bacterium]